MPRRPDCWRYQILAKESQIIQSGKAGGKAVAYGLQRMRIQKPIKYSFRLDYRQ